MNFQEINSDDLVTKVATVLPTAINEVSSKSYSYSCNQKYLLYSCSHPFHKPCSRAPQAGNAVRYKAMI